MKKLNFLLIAFLLTCSCVEIPIEPKIEAMSNIKPSIFNAVNFSDDFNRESKFYNPFLQRKKGIVSSVMPVCLSFRFTPETMPEKVPSMYLYANKSDGSTSVAIYSHVEEFEDSYIYFIYIKLLGLIDGDCDFYVKVSGYDDILYSEKYKHVTYDDLSENGIVSVLAYNNDFTHGYTSAAYRSAGYFEVSDLNGNIFANDKTEYSYSYGRKKILSSENYIKKRLTFINLSMYQQNLLKTLCNCENLFISGIQYYLASDFTEIGKDADNEVCDLQADFVQVEQSFFATGATEKASDLQLKNLFVR